jgi:hypothetical protein
VYKPHIIEASHQPEIELNSVGRCIYCGIKTSPPFTLTREHIIPNALHGDLILPNASCNDCAKIISDFEENVLSQNFGIIRAKKGLKSRNHPRSANIGLQNQITETFNWSKKHNKNIAPKMPIPLDDIPPVLALEYIEGRPGLVTGQNKLDQLRIFYGGADPSKVKREITVGIKVVGGQMTRLLCKIAHGYAVSQVGYSNFKPYLVPFITGKSLDGIAQFVGSAEAAATSALHRISIGEILCPERDQFQLAWKKRLVVHLQLFADSTPLLFELVVGHLETTGAEAR